MSYIKVEVTKSLLITSKGKLTKLGYTPKTNRTILIDDGGGKVVVNDYRTMEVVA